MNDSDRPNVDPWNVFDISLIILSAISLILYFLLRSSGVDAALAVLSFLGLLPVIYSASKSLLNRRISVDLLASIALIFSLLAQQWPSAAFITLMLAFARVFDRITQERAKKIIRSLMKYHVENVRLLVGETIKEVHIKNVRPGDSIVVEAGDRMPVDGSVISGTADVDESTLTGESELVPKKTGDKVYTSTMNESGSLVVRAEKVGADTTLSRIIELVAEASRNKSRAERVADTFTQWYIAVTLAASILLFAYGVSYQEILSILLVVCADDIAVAVPLAFTSAISRTAKRGVIVKGSAAFEQLSRVRYMLTDKTGTLTRGKPKVVDIKAYGGLTEHRILELAGMGASESRHSVSRAIITFLSEKGVNVHATHKSQEISGQGMSYTHNSDHMTMGRPSFLEEENVRISSQIKTDLETEKDAGRGVVLVSLNGQAVGLIAYRDELRPHVREIIATTRKLGIKEWHMLTGDNEHAAKAVAAEIGLRHYHANMTPQSKVAFISRFERERDPEIVGYIGDGVNDAASLALVDVSLAMGGIGSDAAIEAADITIMKDRLYRLPEVMRTARQVRGIMWQCFAIWAVTNALGLVWATAGLPYLGVLGPSGAAAFNFLTDFIPIGNALRAGRMVANGKN